MVPTVTKDYDFTTATEGERWAHDQGYERGWAERLNPDTMDLDELRGVLVVLIAVADRMIAERRS
jgi:hypothetical protein